MRALIVDHAAPGGLRLADVPDPVPAPDEALVRVRAISLNPGEQSQIAQAPQGRIVGWEGSAIVEQPAADGTGPPRGTAVITVGMTGGWAELRAVPTMALGVVPEGADLDAAATLPIAAGSALRSLRALGPILGRRIMVTGATGGVGAYAVQLAARGGAEVVACACNADKAGWLRELGATEVHQHLESDVDSVDGAIDNVGGPTLRAAFALLRPGGTVLTLGRSAHQDAVFAPEEWLGDAVPRRSIRTFFLFEDGMRLDRDLSLLAKWAHEGTLHSTVDELGRFEDAPALVANGWPAGKHVLRLAA